MRAYLKFTLLLLITILVDQVQFAPVRQAAAIDEEAMYDWPLCARKVEARFEDLNRSYADDATRPSIVTLWDMAREDHLRHCHRPHLTDKIAAGKSWSLWW